MSHNNPTQELAVVETFRRRRVDAIIVTSSRIGRLYSTLLDAFQIPVVLVNNEEEGRYLYSVAADDVQGGQLAVEHLIRMGHRRIGYLGAPNRPKSNRRRLSGYQQVCQQADLEVGPKLMPVTEAEDDFTRGQTALPHFLAADATAVFCYNDMTAIGLIAACHQAGISVPKHLSIVGFDDIEPALYTTPALTTIRQPRSMLGELAMKMVLDLLQQHEAGNRRLPCELIVRGSTAQPAG
jgi:LacI family transcriptional regulator/LacI family repressor for deo operon, udp, cdd, tsx, nupC, and nupG